MKYKSATSRVQAISYSNWSAWLLVDTSHVVDFEYYFAYKYMSPDSEL